jgi:hypothetical protein
MGAPQRQRQSVERSCQESLRTLAKRYSVNPKTVAKRRSRKSVADLPTGPKEPRSTVLAVEEEAVVVAFEFICKAWTSQPQRFTISPLQKIPGLNS